MGAPWSAEPRVPKKVSPCSLVQKCFRRAAKRRCSCQSVSGSWLTFCTTFGKRPSAIMLFMHALYLTFTSRVWRRRLTHSEPLVQKKPHRKVIRSDVVDNVFDKTDIKAKCSHTKQCGALDFDICLKKVRLVKYWFFCLCFFQELSFTLPKVHYL